MEANDYQVAALRTANDIPEMTIQNPLLLDGLLGLVGESGECADLLKKHLFQGHELDTKHLIKELGDVSWYLAITAYALGYDLETVFRTNIAKLRERYPDGFVVHRSINRKDGDL